MEQYIAFALVAAGIIWYLRRPRHKTSIQDFSRLLVEAGRGNAQAQHRIGAMYYTGDGVRQDTKEAAKWLAMAARQGHGEAAELLAEITAQGEEGEG